MQSPSEHLVSLAIEARDTDRLAETLSTQQLGSFELLNALKQATAADWVPGVTALLPLRTAFDSRTPYFVLVDAVRADALRVLRELTPQVALDTELPDSGVVGTVSGVLVTAATEGSVTAADFLLTTLQAPLSACNAALSNAAYRGIPEITDVFAAWGDPAVAFHTIVENWKEHGMDPSPAERLLPYLPDATLDAWVPDLVSTDAATVARLAALPGLKACLEERALNGGLQQPPLRRRARF